MAENNDSTIHQAFECLSMKDLNRLRKMTEYPIKSNLNKSDLVDALEANFHYDPEALLNKLPIYDLVYISELCQIPRDYCLTCNVFPYIPYSMIFNIVDWDFVKDDKNMIQIWLSDDMYRVISPVIDNVLAMKDSNKSYVVDFIFWGMLWVYGTPTMEDFIHVMAKEFGPEDERWHTLYYTLLDYFPFIDMLNGDLCVNPAIKDQAVLQHLREINGMDKKPIKEYSLDDIVAVGSTGPYFHFGVDTKECRNVMKALSQCGFDYLYSSARISRLYRDIQEVDSTNLTPAMLLNAIGIPDTCFVGRLNTIVKPIMEYINNVPRWFLGGRTPKDIPLSPDAKTKIAELEATTHDISIRPNLRGVEGDELCPCGSGIKYKNCHGKGYKS